MTDTATLEDRLRTVERALTEGDHDLDGVTDAAAAVDRIDTIDDRLADLESRVAELEAATQAVRGYVGNVRSVNDAVERRADAALATADRLEDRVARLEDGRHEDARHDPERDGGGRGETGQQNRDSAGERPTDGSAPLSETPPQERGRATDPDGGDRGARPDDSAVPNDVDSGDRGGRPDTHVADIAPDVASSESIGEQHTETTRFPTDGGDHSGGDPGLLARIRALL